MDIFVSGIISQILPIQQGVSQKTGQPWMTAQYIIEHESGQYPRRMVFDVKGQQRIQEMNLQVGEQVMLHLNVDCREWQGRYFNSIEAWKAERPGQQQYAPQCYQQPIGQQMQQGFQQMPPQQPVQNPFPPQPAPMPQQQMPVQQPAPGAAPFPPQQPMPPQGGAQPVQGQQGGLPF